MSAPLISFEKVDFSYKSQATLKSFDFTIDDQQLVAMVGVNGSGKSTLLRLMLGLLQPQMGSIQVLGHPPGNFSTKKFVGSALQEVDFPSSEKVEELLSFVCDQYPESLPVDKLVETFQLQDFRRKACGQLSGGMRRRVALACAFAGKPKLVLLDEPTTGLDLDSRLQLMKTLKAYQSQYPSLILMISHHPEEVMESVDQFLHVKNKKVERLSTANMKKSMGLRKIQFLLAEETSLPEARRKTQVGQRVEVVCENSDQYIRDLVSQNIPFTNLQIDKLNVEELLGEFL